MDIAKECITAIEDLIEKAHLKNGDIVVVGCSTSEVLGSKIGTNSSPDTAKILFEKEKVEGDEFLALMENKPLARMLYDKVEIEEEVPQEMYQAVAEILAMVYNLNKTK